MSCTNAKFQVNDKEMQCVNLYKGNTLVSFLSPKHSNLFICAYMQSSQFPFNCRKGRIQYYSVQLFLGKRRYIFIGKSYVILTHYVSTDYV